MPDIAPTLLTEGQSETNASSYATASIAPSAQKLVLAFVNQVTATAASGSNVPTCSGAGMTWVQVATQAYDSENPDRGRFTMFRALDSSPGSGALTFSFGGETQARASWGVVEFSNVVTSGADGADAIVQVGQGEKLPADSDADLPLIVLAAFADVANATFGAIGVGFPDVTVTVGSGFTETNNIAVGVNGSRTQSQFKATNDTTVDWTLGALGTESGFIALELANGSNLEASDSVDIDLGEAASVQAIDPIDVADDADLSLDEAAEVETTDLKDVADTLDVDLGEAAEALILAGPPPGPDLITLGDFAEFGAPLAFDEIENDPPDAFTLADDPELGAAAPFTTGRTLIIAEIKLSGGGSTLFRAAKGIRHPTRMYVGKVKSFGSIIRSVQVPSGFPQIGDAEVTIIDTDGELRQLMSATPPQNREVVLKIGDEGESESIFQTIYTGIITHATFPPGLARIRLQDNTFKFLQEQLPDLLTRDNFVADPLFAKNLRARTEGRFDEREIFSPIAFGELDSTGLDVVGSVNAVRLDSTTFNLAQHPIPHAPIKIFTKFPGEETFLEQAFGFSIVEVDKTIEGIDYTFTHIVFGSAQPDGTEVRWDGEGMTDDGTKDGTVIRSPAEAIKQYLIRIARRDVDEIDLIGFDAAGATMADVVTGGPSPGLFCDGAVTERMFHREVLSRMNRSFGIFMFTDKLGKITIRYIGESDPNRPIVDDVQDIYVKTETHALARPIVNEVNLQYLRMFSEQSWQGLLTVPDDDAIEALQRTESRDLKLFFVRDDFVADRVARDFLQFTNPSSFRIVMTIPGHRRTADVELAKLIGITNYSGLDPLGFGYDNKEFLVHKTEFITDSKQLKVHAVARAEPPALGLTEGTALEIFTVVAADGLNEPGEWLELTGRPARDDGFVNPIVLPFTPKWVTISVQQGFGGFPGVPFPTIGLLDFGVGVPGNVIPVIEEIGITIDATGVDAATSRWYSFPYVGQGDAAFRKDKRLFVRARDNQDGPAESAPQTHNWSGDITLWR